MLGWNGINLLNIYGGFYECMDIDEKGWMNQYFQIVLQLDLGKCQSFLVATTRFFLGGGSWSVRNPNLQCRAMVEQQPKHRNLPPAHVAAGNGCEMAGEL